MNKEKEAFIEKVLGKAGSERFTRWFKKTGPYAKLYSVVNRGMRAVESETPIVLKKTNHRLGLIELVLDSRRELSFSMPSYLNPEHIHACLHCDGEVIRWDKNNNPTGAKGSPARYVKVTPEAVSALILEAYKIEKPLTKTTAFFL